MTHTINYQITDNLAVSQENGKPINKYCLIVMTDTFFITCNYVSPGFDVSRLFCTINQHLYLL